MLYWKGSVHRGSLVNGTNLELAIPEMPRGMFPRTQISQNLRSIGPVIRKQTDLWVIFKNPNKNKLIEQIYEEIGGAGVSIEQFNKYFDYICEQPYGSLIISCIKDDIKVRLGWDKELILKE